MSSKDCCFQMTFNISYIILYLWQEDWVTVLFINVLMSAQINKSTNYALEMRQLAEFYQVDRLLEQNQLRTNLRQSYIALPMCDPGARS